MGTTRGARNGRRKSVNAYLSTCAIFERVLLLTFKDVREYLRELDRLGLLVRVTRPTNKDTEICPLVRWQFQGLDTEQRRGWILEYVTDSRGR